MAHQDADRCRALTASGERCSRPAGEDGFCYQHDESDETVDEDAGAASAESTGNEATARPVQSDGGAEVEEESDDDEQQETDRGSADEDAPETDAEGGSDGDRAGSEVAGGVVDIRNTVASTAGQLIGRKLDGIIEVTNRDDHWDVVVEVVERSSVPDTQDILGRYELTVDDPDTITGYRRVDTYRRGDSDRDEGRT